MKIVVAGANGLIGAALVEELKARGDVVVPLVRRGDGVRWDGRTAGPWTRELEGADAVVNLAGSPVAQRWSESVKKQIQDSRVRSTRALVEALRGLAQRPRVLVNGSAVGFYGLVSGDAALSEAAPPGSDFLAQVCVAWEAEAARAEELGVRVVLPRTGVVLSARGGALEKMLLPFRAFVGGPVGSGRQWTPWIHLQDEVRALLFCLDRDLRGPVNLVAPNPARMEDFARELGRALGRPSWVRVPETALKALLGEFSSVLTEGQRALPSKLLAEGFAFRFPTLSEALSDLLGARKSAA